MAISVQPPFERRDPALPLRGRTELLAQLSHILDHPDSQPRVRILHGLNGCGKTSLALELAHEATKRSVRVWWVEAAAQTRFIAGMDAITAELDPDHRPQGDPDTLWRELERFNWPWLLVVNDADDPDLINGAATGARWIRPLQKGLGLVLVTSRRDRTAWGLSCEHKVPMLRSADAALVLNDYTQGRAGTLQEASRLAERLGGLPLALRMVGAYLAETTNTPEEFVDADTIRSFGAYRDALDTGQLSVFEVENVTELTDPQAQRVIGLAWDLSLGLLDQSSPEARPVLQLLSCLDNVPVPRLLLAQASAALPAGQLPRVDRRQLWRVLQDLALFDLIDLSGENLPGREPTAAVASARDDLWVHPLVRDVSRQHLERDPNATSYFSVIAAMLERVCGMAEIGQPDDPASRTVWQAIAPHAFHVLRSAVDRTGLPIEDVRRIIRAATLAARHLSARGLYHQAELEWQAIKNAAERNLGESDSDTLAAGREFAVALAARGKFQAAEDELRSVLRRQSDPDDVTHLEALRTRHQLATVLRARGQLAAAEEEYRTVLSGQQTILGENHSDTLATRYDLARLLHARGQLTEAQGAFDAIWSMARELYGDEHPITLTYQHQQARVLRARGLLVEALETFDMTLGGRRRALGSEHPDTLVTRHHRARVLRALGRTSEAAAEFGDVLAAQRRELGDDHPETLASHHQWARVLWVKTEFAAAEAEFDEVLSIRRRTLGDRHPDTLTTRVQRARVIRAQGRYDEAEAEFDAVLAMRVELLGDDHPDTLATRHNIAHLLWNRGQLQPALELYGDVLVAQRKKIGDRHPDTLATRHSLASVRVALGDLEVVKAEFEEVLRLRGDVLGAQHPDTVASRHSHIGVLRTLSREEADARLRDTLEIYQHSWANGLPELERLQRARGRLAEAEAELEAALAAVANIPQQRSKP